MPSQDDWLQAQVAPTTKALADGDGCHRDEAQALGDFLEGSLNAQEAARRITRPVSHEANPPAELYRLWGLLCEALVELGDEDSQKTMELLSAIEKLPPTTNVDWSQLPGFGSMWFDLHRLHLHGPIPWEKETLTKKRKAELCAVCEAKGVAEARMYVRDLCVPADWGFEIIDLVCSKRPGLEIYLNEIYAWLRIAGTKLKGSMILDETKWSAKRFSNPVANSLEGGRRDEDRTMAEQWATWKETLYGLSRDQNLLSAEGRSLAATCHELM